MVRKPIPLRRIAAASMLCLALLALGCNPKLGLVVLNTNPPEATVYVNQERVGETPVTFELNLRKPVSLSIVKEGYMSRAEIVNVNWVRGEYREGNYTKGDYLIHGKMQWGFEVRTVRTLVVDVEAQKRRAFEEEVARGLEENARKFQEFKTWCASMVGKDYHEVVKTLGLPGRIIEIPNGHKTMIFDRGFQQYKPRFETDRNGRVVSWTF